MAKKLLESGVSSFALCGTTGECAALLWDEKRGFITTMVDTVKKRVPIFAGATALGTKEVIRQMRELSRVGAEGAFLGLPLWQTPTLTNSIQFYADLSEAVPDMAIMVYSNSNFFKSDFPVEFWEGAAKKAPTVITNKIAHGIEHLADEIRVAGHQITFVPGASAAYEAYKKVPGKFTAIWSTGPGPEPHVALIDAMNSGDVSKVEQIQQDLRAVPAAQPQGAMAPGGGLKGWQGRMASSFAHYNVQFVKQHWNASGFQDVGPLRPPYIDLPDEWKKAIEIHEKPWAELRQKYIKKVPVR
jgi:trans-o-hydroxybenzylidenepyruvate hydratase-aldolase